MHHKSIKKASIIVHHLRGRIKTKDANNMAMLSFGNQKAKNSDGSFHKLEINTE